jgi:2-oxoglutarate ferredoxin oxidoreductase subunit beta
MSKEASARRVESCRRHKGAAFVEILQNCNVFNDGAFESLTDKGRKLMHNIARTQSRWLGKTKTAVFASRELSLEVVTLGNGIGESDLLVHRTWSCGILPSSLPRVPRPSVFSGVGTSKFDEMMNRQIAEAKASSETET